MLEAVVQAIGWAKCEDRPRIGNQSGAENIFQRVGSIPEINDVSVLGIEVGQVHTGIDEFHNLLSFAQSVKLK